MRLCVRVLAFTSAAALALVDCRGDVVVLGGESLDGGRATAGLPDGGFRDAGALDAGPASDAPSGDAAPDASPPPVGVDAGPASATAPAAGITTLAVAAAYPTAIAVDRTSVYWNNGRGEGEVVKVSTEGGEPVTLEVGSAVALAVDATSVYWTGAGSVMKMPVDGGDVTTLASGQAAPVAIAVDANDVYWTNDNDNNAAQSGSVVKVALDGGTPVTLASGLDFPARLAVDGQNAYWLEEAALVFNGYQYQATLWRSVPLAGGAPTTLASSTPFGSMGFPSQDGLAAYQGNLYTVGTWGLVRMPADGGAQVTLAAGGNPFLAVGGGSVYWTTSNESTGSMLARVPLGGGAPFVIAMGQNYPGPVAVDDSNVYWVACEAVPCTIMKAPR